MQANTVKKSGLFLGNAMNFFGRVTFQMTLSFLWFQISFEFESLINRFFLKIRKITKSQ